MMVVASKQTTRMEEMVFHILPQNRPLSWFLVNLMCCVWSMVLTLTLVFYEHTKLDRFVNTQNYMLYNFFTTGIWCLEAGLTLWWETREARITADDATAKNNCNCNCNNWKPWIEWIGACYFLYTSIILVGQRIDPHRDVTVEVRETMLNICGYTYQSWNSYHTWLLLSSTHSNSNNTSSIGERRRIHNNSNMVDENENDYDNVVTSTGYDTIV